MSQNDNQSAISLLQLKINALSHLETKLKQHAERGQAPSEPPILISKVTILIQSRRGLEDRHSVLELAPAANFGVLPIFVEFLNSAITRITAERMIAESELLERQRLGAE